jgi:type II secretory pathway predicted ATPase ExeA/cell division protein FtsN
VNTLGHPRRVESYEKFFGLNEAPFSLTPNPRFVFESASHASALAQVAYALERREPLVVITGEIGVGKTLLCRTVVNKIQRKIFLSVISDPQLERDDLLKQLLQDFGVISKDRSKLGDTSRHDLFRAVRDFLASLVPLQAHAVVIIDEAQHMQPEVLEQIRLLSNIDDARGTLLQIILVGQTDLEPVLSRPELRQFQQRVSRRFRLEPLSPDEVQQYIAHRIAVARDGGSTAPGVSDLEREVAEWAKATAAVTFAPDAVREIAKLSGGLPRVINLLCDRALEAAFAERAHRIDLNMVDASAHALGLPAPAASATRAEPTLPAAAMPPVPGSALGKVEGPALSGAKGLALSGVERPALSKVEGPALSKVEGPALSKVEGPAPAAPPTVTNQPRPSDIRRAAEPPPSVEHKKHPAPSRGRDVPVAFGPLAQIDRASSNRKWLVIALLVVAAAAIVFWFMSRSGSQPAAPRAPSPATEVPPPGRPAAAPPPAAPPTEPDGPAPSALATPSAQPSSGATTPAPSAAATPSAADGFEIVVASFRTDARATAVAAQVTGLGIPVRRRVSDGWQQVMAGPFASRPEAADAQARLDRAGLTGTQIVPR